MKSGKLRHQIQIQQATTDINAAGTPVDVWKTIHTLRAEVIQQTAQEYVRNQGAVDEVTIVFRVRNVFAVATVHRVLFNGVAYNIRQIVPIENDRGLELQAVKIGGGA